MPGTNAGTGVPVSFRCYAERRESSLDRALGDVHEVYRTGAEKPFHSKGRQVSRRLDDVSRQYVCTCGYVGWSALKELAKYPTQDELVDPIADVVEAEPSGTSSTPGDGRPRIPSAQRAG